MLRFLKTAQKAWLIGELSTRQRNKKLRAIDLPTLTGAAYPEHLVPVLP
jgi:hypothetical protein